MRILLSGLLLLALSSPALAQPASSPLRRELARATFLLGEWEGRGWIKLAPDDEPISLRVTSEGKPILAGLRLAWKSVGRGDGGMVSEDNFSLRFRSDSAAFRVSVHAPGHPAMDGWARVAGCELSRELQIPGPQPGAGSQIRYTIRVDAENRLTEMGERSGDGGRTWWQFYAAEMAGRSGEGCRASAAQAPASTTGGGER